MEVQRYQRILRQCFPDLTVTSIKFLGGGTYRVFEVSTGVGSEPNLVLRFPQWQRGWRPRRTRATRLQAAAPTPTDSHPRATNASPRAARCLGSLWLATASWAGFRCRVAPLRESNPPSVAAELGDFLTALHAEPQQAVEGAGLPSFIPAQMREAQGAFYAEVKRRAFPILSARE
jgi:hypothetical protein